MSASLARPAQLRRCQACSSSPSVSTRTWRKLSRAGRWSGPSSGTAGRCSAGNACAWSQASQAARAVHAPQTGACQSAPARKLLQVCVAPVHAGRIAARHSPPRPGAAARQRRAPATRQQRSPTPMRSGEDGHAAGVVLPLPPAPQVRPSLVGAAVGHPSPWQEGYPRPGSTASLPSLAGSISAGSQGPWPLVPGAA